MNIFALGVIRRLLMTVKEHKSLERKQKIVTTLAYVPQIKIPQKTGRNIYGPQKERDAIFPPTNFLIWL